ncbi:unnamed protein product, partial [Agarophyton chilense]
MSDLPPTQSNTANVVSPPPLPPSSSLHQLQANFAAFTPRYSAAIHDPTSIKPLLIPADAYFTTPRCSVCTASFTTFDLLDAHVRTCHLPHTSPHNASPLAPIVAPASTQHSAFLPPWLRPSDSFLNETPCRNTNNTVPQYQQPLSAFAPTSMPEMPISTPTVTKPDTSQYRCHLCNASCDTKVQFNNHCSGQKHRKKADLFAAFKQAEISFSSESIQFHPPSTWHCLLCTVVMHAHNEVLQHLQCVKHTRLSHRRQNQEPGVLRHPAILNPSADRLAARNMPVTAIKPPAVSAAMAAMQSPITESQSASFSPPHHQHSDPVSQLVPSSSSSITMRGTISKFANTKTG